MTREQWRKEFWKRLERAYADKDNARFDKEKRLNKKHWLKRLFRL